MMSMKREEESGLSCVSLKSFNASDIKRVSAARSDDFMRLHVSVTRNKVLFTRSIIFKVQVIS